MQIIYIYTHNTQVHDIEVNMEEQTAVLTGQIAELESRANYISVIHVARRYHLPIGVGHYAVK
jgi:hypothetical protein